MGLIDGLNKTGEVRESITELVSSKKELILKQSVNVVLLFIILLVFGCFDFLHLSFHFEYLADANFWFSVGTKAIADICAYNVGINVIIDDVIKRNKTLCRLKETYDNLNAYKETDDFEKFIQDYNRECKIAQFKSEINYKIYKLNKRSKRSDRLLYSSKTATEDEKKKNKYCVARYELDQLKSDEFINENIDALSVKYRDIDAGIFELEINGTQRIIQNKVTGSINKGRAIASFTTLAGVIIAPILINSFGLDPNKQEFEDGVVAGVNVALKMASDIGIIIWQFLRGIFATPKIVSQQVTLPLEERVKILKKYYSWRSSTGKTVPQCYLNLFKEETNEEIVEISQEEYEKIKNEQKEEKDGNNN